MSEKKTAFLLSMHGKLFYLLFFEVCEVVSFGLSSLTGCIEGVSQGKQLLKAQLWEFLLSSLLR
jgi:hypothetical protein